MGSWWQQQLLDTLAAKVSGFGACDNFSANYSGGIINCDDSSRKGMTSLLVLRFMIQVAINIVQIWSTWAPRRLTPPTARWTRFCLDSGWVCLCIHPWNSDAFHVQLDALQINAREFHHIFCHY